MHPLITAFHERMELVLIEPRLHSIYYNQWLDMYMENDRFITELLDLEGIKTHE